RPVQKVRSTPKGGAVGGAQRQDGRSGARGTAAGRAAMWRSDCGDRSRVERLSGPRRGDDAELGVGLPARRACWRSPVKLPWLTPVLEQSGPFLSVHLDTTRTDPAAASELEARWAQMRSRLGADGAPSALLDESEETVLSPSSLGGRQGRSHFAT